MPERNTEPAPTAAELEAYESFTGHAAIGSGDFRNFVAAALSPASPFATALADAGHDVPTVEDIEDQLPTMMGKTDA